MKKISDFWPKALFKVTGFIFLTQLAGEVLGIYVRKEGFEDTLLFCFIAFIASSFYAFAVIAINASRPKE